MANKAMFFLFAYVLLAATRVSSAKDETVLEVPAHAPEKSHVHHHPNKAHCPTYSPAEPPAHHSKKAPAHPPAKAEAPSPLSAPTHSCVLMCEEYCKNHRRKRPCMKVCTACCRQYKCVPGLTTKCTTWSHVKIHEVMIKCP